MSSALDNLTARHRRFVELHAGGMPAGEAWTAAGFKSKGRAAEASAARALTYANIREALAEMQRGRPEVADREERLAWLTNVIRGAVEDRGEPAALKDRLKAAEMLAKMGGDYTQNHNHVVRSPEDAIAAYRAALTGE